MLRKIVYILLFITIVITTSLNVYATQTSNTNYKIIIEDDADLLTDEEEKELYEEMVKITEYGNVVFKTTSDVVNYNSLKYIQDYYYSILNNNPGVAFYIDMKNRQVCACATGGLDSILTSSKCNIIMDNTYKYATNSQYYKCADEVFIQMNRLLSGGKIQENMKYICNAFLSIMIALFVNFGVFMTIALTKKASNKEIIDECAISFDYSPIQAIRTGSHSEYSPQSSGSSGSRRSVAEAGGRWSADFPEAEEVMDFNFIK